MAVVLSEREKGLLIEAREYSLKHFQIYSDKWESEGRFPRETFRQAAKDGYLGLASSEELGGKNYGFLECFLTYEGLAYGDPGVTTYLHIHNSLTAELEKWYGIGEPIRKLLPDFVQGRKFIAFALTEMEAGSDPAMSSAFCDYDGTDYIITGEKAWISNSEGDDYYQVVVKAPDRQGMVMLLVDRHSEGLRVCGNVERIGGNAVACGKLEFDRCRVPKENLLSEKGMSAALRAIDVARLYAAASALGLAQRAVDISAEYLSSRKTFGRAVIENQGVQWRLAEMSTEIEAARWLAYHTASVMDAGERPGSLAAMCKLQATNTAARIAGECIRFFGASGLDRHAEISRLMAMSHVLEITDGTNEIQKMVIGRGIARQYSGK